MKRSLILFALPLMIYSCGSGEKTSGEKSENAEKTDAVEMKRSDVSLQHLIGDVKMITETPYTPGEDGSVGEMDSCCVEMKEFDESGFRKKVTEKNKEGEVTAVNTIEITETGAFLSSTWVEDGKEVWKRVVSRDADGKALGAVDTDSTQQVTRRHKAEKYNEFEQPLMGTTYLADSTYLGTWAYDYTDGLRTNWSWTDSTGVERAKRTGEVNDKGWISRIVDVRVQENGDTVTTIETYSYDSFDDMGNWTQRTEYNDEKPVKVLKRSYAYYEE